MKTFAELLYFPSSSTSRLVLTSCDTGSSWCFTVGTEMFRLTSEVVFSFTWKAIFSLTPTFTELCGDYQHVEAQQSLSTGARTQITGVKTCFTRSVC